MATTTPSSTPNPDAMKFTLDVKLPAMINVARAEAAGADAFTRAVFASDGVASLFGVNDFVTITRVAGAEWGPIIDAVAAAAADHL